MSSYDRVRPRRTAAAVLLRRGPDLQIGLGAAAVVIADHDRRWHQLLDRCQGKTPMADLIASSTLDRTSVDAAMEELVARGFIDVARPRRAGMLRVRLIGAGVWAATLARALPALGFSRVYVYDPSPPDATLYPQTHARQQSEALCRQLDANCFRPVPHWTKPAGVQMALTLVGTDALEADRGLTDELLRADQPHLVVRPLPAGAVVGPLVIPGRTACMRCCDLRQRDLDPQWPSLLPQLERERGPAHPAIRAWACAVAGVQIRGFLAGRAVDTESGTLELTDSDPRQVWRSWPPHPECSCRW